MSAPASPPAGWTKRILWLIAIWACSVAALGALAFAMRMLMKVADLCVR